MGVQIIKEIDLCHSNCCFKNSWVRKDSEILNDSICNNNFNENGKLPAFSSSKIEQIFNNKIKAKKLNKFSRENNSSISFINIISSKKHEINNYKIIKLQSYIRQFLVRKKYNLINFRQEKKDNEDEDFLAIPLLIEDSLFSFNYNSNNYKTKKSKYTKNINFSPFCLKTKNNMKYKYFYNGAYFNKYRKNKEINNKNNGFGIIIFNDNTIFKSKFIENKASGISQYIDYKNKYEYIGEYKKNNINGFGIYTYNTNIFRITGYFKNDGLYGIGIEESNYNKYIYYGEFYQNKKHGIGVIQWSEQIKYSGQFFENELHGRAIIEYPENKIYKGYVKKGKLDGFGEFIWPGEKKYIGLYKNNKKEGFGIFLWNYNNNNNIKFEKIKALIGFWNKGNMNGIGIRINSGKIKYGIWKNGKRIKWFEKKEIFKIFIDINQKKYLKIFLGNKNEIFNLLKNYYFDSQIDDEI